MNMISTKSVNRLPRDDGDNQDATGDRVRRDTQSYFSRGGAPPGNYGEWFTDTPEDPAAILADLLDHLASTVDIWVAIRELLDHMSGSEVDEIKVRLANGKSALFSGNAVSKTEFRYAMKLAKRLARRQNYLWN